MTRWLGLVNTSKCSTGYAGQSFPRVLIVRKISMSSDNEVLCNEVRSNAPKRCCSDGQQILPSRWSSSCQDCTILTCNKFIDILRRNWATKKRFGQRTVVGTDSGRLTRCRSKECSCSVPERFHCIGWRGHDGSPFELRLRSPIGHAASTGAVARQRVEGVGPRFRLLGSDR